MKILKTASYKIAQDRYKKDLALKLLDWHGGQWSPLYRVGSTWLAGKKLLNNDEDIQEAIQELEDIAQKKVNYPKTITEQNISEIRELQNKLKREMIGII
jgi:hypothetical protein